MIWILIVGLNVFRTWYTQRKTWITVLTLSHYVLWGMCGVLFKTTKIWWMLHHRGNLHVTANLFLFFRLLFLSCLFPWWCSKRKAIQYTETANAMSQEDAESYCKALSFFFFPLTTFWRKVIVCLCLSLLHLHDMRSISREICIVLQGFSFFQTAKSIEWSTSLIKLRNHFKDNLRQALRVHVPFTIGQSEATDPW